MPLPSTVSPDVMPSTEPIVLVRRHGAVGRITLNRPRALNPLDTGMVTSIRAGLADFEAAPSVSLVLIDSTSPRAFCAGGDIGPIWRMVKAGEIEAARAICRDEYDLDLSIARFAKPVVTLIDGLVMGGGIGISCHANHPVITERATLSLPETGIGWVPDSGVNAILTRSSGQTGKYLALTGKQASAGSMHRAGFGRYFVQSRNLPALIEALLSSGDPATIAEFECTPPAGEIAAIEEEIDTAFAGCELFSILTELDRHPGDSWQCDAARRIRLNSPAACQTALDLLSGIGPDETLEQIINKEFEAVSDMLAHPDFLEGVRAHIVERDRRPIWVSDKDTRTSP